MDTGFRHIIYMHILGLIYNITISYLTSCLAIIHKYMHSLHT